MSKKPVDELRATTVKNPSNDSLTWRGLGIFCLVLAALNMGFGLINSAIELDTKTKIEKYQAERDVALKKLEIDREQSYANFRRNIGIEHIKQLNVMSDLARAKLGLPESTDH